MDLEMGGADTAPPPLQPIVPLTSTTEPVAAEVPAPFPPLLEMWLGRVLAIFRQKERNSNMNPEENITYEEPAKTFIHDNHYDPHYLTRWQYFFVAKGTPEARALLPIVGALVEELQLTRSNQVKVIMFNLEEGEAPQESWERWYGTDGATVPKRNILSFVLKRPLSFSRRQQWPGVKIDVLSSDIAPSRTLTEPALRDIYQRALYKWYARDDGISLRIYRDEADADVGALEVIGYQTPWARVTRRALAFLGGYTA